MEEVHVSAHIRPAVLATHAIERVTAEVEAAIGGDLPRWWFAITDAHLALTAALVETIGGKRGAGAILSTLQSQWNEHLKDIAATPSRPRKIAEFHKLLTRAQDAANAPVMGGRLLLTQQQKDDLAWLHRLRGDVINIKPVEWILETSALPRVFGTVAEAMRQMFELPPLRLHQPHDVDLDRAMATILRLIAITFSAS